MVAHLGHRNHSVGEREDDAEVGEVSDAFATRYVVTTPIGTLAWDGVFRRLGKA